MPINRSSDVPRYAQLKDIIKGLISKGAYEPGNRIPAERELAVQHGVSRITATRAVRDLVQEGVLFREHGRGTFVCEPRTARSMNIAFVMRTSPSQPSSFYMRMFSGIEQITASEGYTLSISSLEQGSGTVFRMIEDRRVDGLILVDLWDNAFLREVAACAVPVVLLDWESKAVACDTVCIDDHQATYEATRYLLDLGHRNIGFVNGPRRLAAYVNRLEGYRSALKDHGVRYRKELVLWGGHWIGIEGEAEVEEMIFRLKPTAVATASDSLATGVIATAQSGGLRVPDDLSVIGLGSPASRSEPHSYLTTVGINWTGLGRKAAECLLARVRGDTGVPVRINIPGEIAVGESCRPLWQGGDREPTTENR